MKKLIKKIDMEFIIYFVCIAFVLIFPNVMVRFNDTVTIKDLKTYSLYKDLEWCNAYDSIRENNIELRDSIRKCKLNLKK